MKQIVRLFFVTCLVMMSTMQILAHGVRIDHTIDATSGAITVMAAFDTGEVLNEAAVVIFAPNDLINPWSTGVMDENGSYIFTPDYSIEGFWDIQVRKAGHGGLINIEITADMMPDPTNSITATPNEDNARTITLSNSSQVTIISDIDFTVDGDTVVFETDPSTVQSVTGTQPTSGFTTAQIIIMSVSVIWGFVGTALYFMRRKPKSAT